jgi:sulfide:quinone oxidoreductase
MRKFMADREIELMKNTEIERIEPDTFYLKDGRSVPFKYAMILPPFRGPKFLREAEGLTDAKGFVPVQPTYRHPEFDSIYGVGVVTQLKPYEQTPIPIGTPKVGQMTEAMVMVAAHNIAVELGVRSGEPIAPTLQAICFADFGDTGALFLADPLLPDAETGKRHRAFVTKGPWVPIVKTAFEKYFMDKMRMGMSMPWFERSALQAIGLPLVAPFHMPVPERA